MNLINWSVEDLKELIKTELEDNHLNPTEQTVADLTSNMLKDDSFLGLVDSVNNEVFQFTYTHVDKYLREAQVHGGDADECC